MDCSLSGSSVHGMLQARTLEWVAMPSSRGSSQPGIQPRSPALQAVLYHMSRQGNPKGLEWAPLPSPGELPSPGTKPMSLGLAGTFFTTEPPANTSLHSIQGSVLEVLFTPISFSFFRVIVPNVQFPDHVLCRDFEILS